MAEWFDVDRKGLARLLERKGKEFVVFELVQNAWDEKTTRVDVTLKRLAGTREVELTVEDDNPNGFETLTHAFVLFADSKKVHDAGKRGRFNLGEKLVISSCREAEIASTTGTIRFTETEGRKTSRVKRERGSRFRGVMRMTNEELERCGTAVRRLLPPPGIATYFNGELIEGQKPCMVTEATLPTEIADADGVLRKTSRKTAVEFHDRLDGSPAMLFELGIPVVETGDRWHVNVQQKIPLNFDRDNVPPAYLAKVRALTLETMNGHMGAEDANATWVRDAIQRHGSDMSDETIRRVTDLRFGEKRVAYDPSDTEANHIAVSQGYQLVYGSQLSSAEWDAAKRAGAILPAGRVTPSAKPYQEGGRPQEYVPRDKWTDHMESTVELIERVSEALLGTKVGVEVTSDITWPFSAAYGGRRMVLNLGRLGHKWFGGPLESISNLMLHELAHEFESSHLSSDYHAALSRLGAKMTDLALSRPELFERSGSRSGTLFRRGQESVAC